MTGLAFFRYTALSISLLLCVTTQSQAAEQSSDDNPPVPPLTSTTLSEHPVRVGLVDSGVNYLLPFIQNALARNAAGQLIGYDYWDMDQRPFDAHPGRNGVIQRHGTQTASLLIKEAPFVRIVPYRYPRPDMQRMELLLEHASAHNVRIMGLALGGNRKEEWQHFERAAKDHPQILFIVSAGNNGRDIDDEPVYPASLSLSNMLVVTSADDFVRPAHGVNWGRVNVDYMVPAEMQTVVRFDGSEALVSGSSYAVPRVAALAARLLKQDSTSNTQTLIAKIRSKFANGAVPRQIGQGYIHDPQLDVETELSVEKVSRWMPPIAEDASASTEELLSIPLDVYVLDDHWLDENVQAVLSEANTLLSQCAVAFEGVTIKRVLVEDYLRDLETGRSKTLMEKIGRGGPNRNPAVFFARDTKMNQPFDAEAFGQGNTRSRPWLTDSVWLTLALRDRGIALAHELFHILANSGEHSTAKGNLMLARTTGKNHLLQQSQCDVIRTRLAAR